MIGDRNFRSKEGRKKFNLKSGVMCQKRNLNMNTLAFSTLSPILARKVSEYFYLQTKLKPTIDEKIISFRELTVILSIN